MARRGFISELFGFVRAHKAWMLLPVIVVLLLFAVALSLVLLLAAVLMRTMVRGAARGLRRR